MNHLTEYLLPFLKEPDIQKKLREQEITRVDVAPSVGPETGRLLSFLIQAMKCQSVLEIGTCQGYSALWMAEGLKNTAGKLTAIESNELIIEEAKEHFTAAGLANTEFIIGDANLILKELPASSFDLILQDSTKAMYIDMLEDCIRVLKVGGILISDDILFKPLGKRASIAEAMHQYNNVLVKDDRLFTTFLTIGDGVALSLKTKE